MTTILADRESNLDAWSRAKMDGTTRFAVEVVRVSPAQAAKDILDDPHWAEKVRRALADSQAGRVRSLSQHRDTL
jgi:hypothetical protein